MNADELIEKTRRAFEAWAGGDPGLLAAELADDVELIFPGDSALAGTKRGREMTAALGERVRYVDALGNPDEETA